MCVVCDVGVWHGGVVCGMGVGGMCNACVCEVYGMECVGMCMHVCVCMCVETILQKPCACEQPCCMSCAEAEGL